MSHIQGIYSIKNLTTGKRYIGKSQAIRNRWYQHRTDLRCNRHFNIYLQNAWNKYGEKDFKFEVLERCTKDELKEREIYWVGVYQSLDKGKGYNLVDESKVAQIPNKLSPRKSILKIDNKNIVVKEYEDLYALGVDLGLEPERARKYIYGSKKKKNAVARTYKGFAYVYKHKYDPNYLYFKEGKPVRAKRKEKQSKNIKSYLLDKQENVIKEFNSYDEIAVYFNIAREKVNDVLNRNNIGNYYLVRAKKYVKGMFLNKPVKELELKGYLKHKETQEVYPVYSISQLAKELNLKYNKLLYLVNGKTNKGNGKFKAVHSYKNYIFTNNS